MIDTVREALDGERAWVVGGAVRDRLLGRRGAEAVLIGARGGERILAEDLARAIGTINYEITCGISARVPREHV